MGISVWQLGLVVLVLILLFGRGRIPTLMTDLAEGIKGFKRGLKDDERGSEPSMDGNINEITETITGEKNLAKQSAEPQKPAPAAVETAPKALNAGLPE